MISSTSIETVPAVQRFLPGDTVVDFRNARVRRKPPEAEFAFQDLSENLPDRDLTAPRIFCDFELDPAQPPEGCRIVVTAKSLSVRASGNAGFIYAVQTLKQLLYLHGGNALPAGEIVDCPHYRWRGFMLDSARNFQSTGRIKRCLDWLTALKINRFHWHLIDAQAWRLEIRRYPELTRIGSVRGRGDEVESGFYSQEDVREIVAYAARRNITVIPEIEMPAHAGALIYCHPELSCKGAGFAPSDIPQSQYEMDGDTPDVRNLCAGKEAVFEFLDAVLTETAALFPSPYLHIGGDERRPGIWSECPDCRARMQEEKLEDEAGLQLYFMSRICRRVRALGKIPVMWAENPERGIPEGAVVQGWRDRETRTAAAAGHPVICSDHPYFYLDYYEYPHMQGVDWLLPLDLEKVYRYEPEAVLAPGELPGLLGTESPLWTSWVTEEEIDLYMFPRLLAVAENQWHPARRDFPAFAGRVARLKGYFAGMGARYAEPLTERPLPTVAPGAAVTTDIPHRSGFPPEKALTPSRYTYSWSSEPPAEGSHFTVTLPRLRRGGELILRFGKTDQSAGVPRSARLEISADAVHFEPAATVEKRRTAIRLPEDGLLAFRLVFPQAASEELVVREIAFIETQAKKGSE